MAVNNHNSHYRAGDLPPVERRRNHPDRRCRRPQSLIVREVDGLGILGVANLLVGRGTVLGGHHDDCTHYGRI